MRKILRNIARTNMELAGIVRMNRGPRSFFARNWRQYVQYSG